MRIKLFIGMFLLALSLQAQPPRGERPPIDLSAVPPDAWEPGKIWVQFSSRCSLPENAFYDKSGHPSVFSGIDALDELAQVFELSRVSSLLQPLYAASGKSLEHASRYSLWGFDRWFELQVPEKTDILAMVKAYLDLACVAHAEPVYRVSLIEPVEARPMEPPVIPRFDPGLEPKKQQKSGSWTPNDTFYYLQWHYHNTGQSGGTPGADIRMPQAWDIEKGNPDVIVAIIDGGIQTNHPDLSGNMWAGTGYNFVDNSPTIVPHNHGTHVAGTVAAVSNNATGVSGIAGGDGGANGVSLMSLQVFTASASGGFHVAPIYAADYGAAISQNSWGYDAPGVYSMFVLDAIDYFNYYGGGNVMHGGITIFAAGNSNSNEDYYPARYSRVLTVASTDHTDTRSGFSNYGSWVDLSAPGSNVASTYINSDYGYMSGTSMACPHVSGVAALVLSHAPGRFSADQLRHILVSTTDDHYWLNPSFTGLLGSGRLNAHAALNYTVQLLQAPASFQAKAESESGINLSWELNAADDPVLLAFSENGVFGSPADGISYTAGQSIPGGGTVLYAGSNLVYAHTSLLQDTRYHYALWSVASGTVYSVPSLSEAFTWCGPVALPFYEGFESMDDTFRCWVPMRNTTESGGLNGGGLNYDASYSHSWRVNLAAAQGNGAVFIRSGSRSARVIPGVSGFRWLVSRPLIIPSSGNIDLRFWKDFETSPVNTTRFHIVVNDGDNWTVLQSYTSSALPPNWFDEEVVLSLNAYRGETIRIAFVYEENGGFEVALDDIRVARTAATVAAGLWSNPATWGDSGKSLLPSQESVLDIRHPLQVDTPGECYGLTLHAGGSLEILPSQSLSVTGELLNLAGAASLIIRSDATGTGSLIHGSADIPATVERFIHGEAFAWQALGSPVASQSFSGSFAADALLYTWHEPSQSWVSIANSSVWPSWGLVNNNADILIPAKGYLAAFPHVLKSNPVKSFAGVLNHGTHTFPLSVLAHPDDAFRGMNLLANPYPSAIDWKASSGWSGLSNLEESVFDETPGYAYWIWNPVAGNYGAYHTAMPTDEGTLGAGRHIPPMHAFWVRAIGEGNLQLTDQIRTHHSQQWQEKSLSRHEPLLLKAGMRSSEWHDQVMLMPSFREDGFEAISGIEKRFGMLADAPSLYFVHNQANYSVVASPLSLLSELLLCFEANVSGTYILSLSGGSMPLDLLDTHTGQWHRLTHDNSYSIHSQKGDDPARFRLFPGREEISTGEQEGLATDAGHPLVYAYRDRLFVNNRWDRQAVVRVYLPSGLVYAGFEVSADASYSLELPPGIYLVTMQSQGRRYSQRVILLR